MRGCLAMVVVSLVTLSGLSARGADFFHTLPADGTSCRYHANINIAGVETTSTWTIASVGTKSVDGEPCRWIELKQLSGDEKEAIRILKFLVPESAFGPDRDPFEDVKQSWLKLETAEPLQLDTLPYYERFVILVIQGPTMNVKKLKQPETVDWQSGKLKCDVFTGDNLVESKPLNLKVELAHRTLANEAVPFRMVGSTAHLDIDIAGQEVTADVKFSIIDTGKEATSALPNVQ